ncbi:FxLD family lanthipeptide [Saccharopolyspora phatthalungensis]|uniref:FxLD family lantipeptide n=1 Tax=Saccharopolyspora phatthalungensis TaxID=664693 RepID=A0A840QFD4_9PSEU|nr:FxLD family lanthipeptide [Saccharopolyspora phatthalungensis]MBB5159544.1 FxLD family lantipeptide [Saccharopolyspora phatthalungensis]
MIGVWPCSDRYARLLYVCTDNGDWAHRCADSPLLRANIRSPTRPGHLARWTGPQQGPAQKSLPCNAFTARSMKIHLSNNGRFMMSAALTTKSPATSPAAATPATEDPFALDLQVITGVAAGHPLAAGKGGTDDGCDPTCASACISDGMPAPSPTYWHKERRDHRVERPSRSPGGHTD